MTDCTFSENTAITGAGMRTSGGSACTVTNCTFRGNIAEESGGGLSNGFGSDPVLTNCAFSGNFAGLGGGTYNEQGEAINGFQEVENRNRFGYVTVAWSLPVRRYLAVGCP